MSDGIAAAANIIKILHILFIAFVVLVPFFGTELFLSYHALTVSLMILHWITNNDICALTIFESRLRGIDENKSFTGKLVKPVYNLQDYHVKYITYVLLFITIYKLSTQYNFAMLWQVYRFILQHYARISKKISQSS